MSPLLAAIATVVLLCLVLGGWMVLRRPLQAPPAPRPASRARATAVDDATRQEIAARQRELESARARRVPTARPAAAPGAATPSRADLVAMLDRADERWGGQDGFAPTMPAEPLDTRR